MLQRYRSLFASRQVAGVWIASLVGRLQLGMLSLSLVLLLHQQRGSFALAGAVAGAQALTTALSSPRKGRWCDRYGVRRVLPALTLTHLTVLAVLLLGARLPDWGVLVLALLIGATRPNLTTYMRVLWRDLHPQEELRERAQALEAAVGPLLIASGPLLVAALVALGGPPLALLGCMACTGVGGLAFARSPVHPYRPAAARAAAAGRLPWRLLALPLAAGLCYSGAFGCLEIALPALCAAHGQAGAAGLLLAAYGVGSLCGGLAYGARRWSWAPYERLVALAALYLGGSLLLLAVDGQLSAGVVLLLMGLPGSAIIACIQYVVLAAAPPERATEALSWWVVVSAVGMAGGDALGGLLVSHSGFAAGLGAAAVLAALTLPCAVLARRPRFRLAVGA